MGGEALSIILLVHLQFCKVATHLEVIINDTCYYAMGGDFDHRPLHVRLSIDCRFVEPQHMVVMKNFLLRFNYDKSKVEEY
jgi:hypothetical protein